MQIKFKNIIRISVITALLLLPYTAYASAGHEEGHAAGISSLTLFFINFALYFALIFFVARKSIPGLWERRRAGIKEAMQSSRAKILAAEKRIAEAGGKLAGAEQEIKQIVNGINQDTKREAEELQASAQRQAERILAQARDSIEAERKVSETAISRNYAKLALEIAEKKLRAQINAETDKTFRSNAQTGLRGLLQ